MFLKIKLKRLLLLFFIILSGLIMVPFNANADTISDKNFEEVSVYHELQSRILSESNKQAIEFFDLIAKWETYGTTEQNQYKELKEFIEKTKKRYSFIKDYKGSLAKEVQKSYSSYCYLMKEELEKNVSGFINGRVIFIDFLEGNIKETNNNFLSFKKNSLDKFLNQYIYTTDNKLAINKLLNGSKEDKKDATSELNKTIKKLEEVETKKIDVTYVENEKKVVKKEYAAPTIIRSYAKYYKEYYKSVLKNDFSKSKKLLLPEKYRIEGLIPVAKLYEEVEEFNFYNAVFSNYTDYTTLDLALKIPTNKIKTTLETIQKQEISTKNIQTLKKFHYEFLYELSEYHKTKDKTKVEKAFDTFNKKYIYLRSYYSRASKRFGNFNINIVNTQITTLKEQSKCINPNLKEINELTYSKSKNKDTTEYRTFFMKEGKIPILIIVVVGIVFVVITIIIVVIRKARFKRQPNYNNYNDYDNNYNDYNNNYNDYNNNYNDEDYY